MHPAIKKITFKPAANKPEENIVECLRWATAFAEGTRDATPSLNNECFNAWLSDCRAHLVQAQLGFRATDEIELVALHSVGSLIDPATGTIYPQCVDGTPDLSCGVDVTDEPSDDWCSALSSADARTVAAIVQGLN